MRHGKPLAFQKWVQGVGNDAREVVVYTVPIGHTFLLQSFTVDPDNATLGDAHLGVGNRDKTLAIFWFGVTAAGVVEHYTGNPILLAALEVVSISFINMGATEFMELSGRGVLWRSK